VNPRKEKPVNKQPKAGYGEIFCRYVIRNGKIIYPRKAKVFHFYVKA